MLYAHEIEMDLTFRTVSGGDALRASEAVSTRTMIRRWAPRTLFASLLVLVVAIAAPGPCAAGDWDALMARLTADGLDSTRLHRLFDRQEVWFDTAAMGRKMLELYESKYGSGLLRKVQTRLIELSYLSGKADGRSGRETRAAIRTFQHVHDMALTGSASEDLLAQLRAEHRRAPAKVTAPPEPRSTGVYRSVITEERLAEARAFLRKNRGLLDEVQRMYGVSAEVAVGIMTVETRVGTYLGVRSAFLTLASMATTRRYEQIAAALVHETPNTAQRKWVTTRLLQKSDWAYAELKALLTYTAANGQDPLDLPGSVYGAIGICQFMPSSALRYGVDGNGDGVLDLFTLSDAVHSMGNFLSNQGLNGARGRNALRKALHCYNPSNVYVNTVLAVAEHLHSTAGQGS